MQRDMDLVREILLSVDARPEGHEDCDIQIPGRSLEVIQLHVQLLADAGLVEGVAFSRGSAGCTRLTWAGYEFIESSRSPSVWEKAKALTIKHTGGLALSALTEALKILFKNAMSAG